MKVTNKYGVPETLVTLATKEYYSKGQSQYSVTELLTPPRIRRLRERRHHEIEQDVSDMLWQLLGSALHVVMERGQTPGHVTEERLFLEMDGVTLSGAIDLQEESAFGVTITDYKFTSAWAVMNDKIEWEWQLNIYKYLVEKVKGKRVVALRICALIRDFNRRETREGYPTAPIQMVDINVWSNDKIEAFIKERLDAHRDSKVPGEDLPRCSDLERWTSETVFAVKREGRKTAIRLFKNFEEANEMAKTEKGYVEARPGEPKRCTGNFCSVAQWCDQYQAELKEKADEQPA